jgi:hypothetical protein
MLRTIAHNKPPSAAEKQVAGSCTGCSHRAGSASLSCSQQVRVGSKRTCWCASRYSWFRHLCQCAGQRVAQPYSSQAQNGWIIRRMHCLASTALPLGTFRAAMGTTRACLHLVQMLCTAVVTLRGTHLTSRGGSSMVVLQRTMRTRARGSRISIGFCGRVCARPTSVRLSTHVTAPPFVLFAA